MPEASCREDIAAAGRIFPYPIMRRGATEASLRQALGCSRASGARVPENAVGRRFRDFLQSNGRSREVEWGTTDTIPLRSERRQGPRKRRKIASVAPDTDGPPGINVKRTCRQTGTLRDSRWPPTAGRSHTRRTACADAFAVSPSRRERKHRRIETIAGADDRSGIPRRKPHYPAAIIWRKIPNGSPG